MKTPERLLAIICLLLALPVALLKLLWLPATVFGFLDAIREFGISGTDSYVQDRNARLLRYVVALILYASGTFSLIGLLGVFSACCRRLAARIVWLCALLTGISLPLLERSRLGPQTDHFYVVCVVHLPLSISVLALAALLWSFYSARHHLHANPIA